MDQSGLCRGVAAQVGIPEQRGAFTDQLLKARILLASAHRPWPPGEDHVIAVLKGDQELVGILGMIEGQAAIAVSQLHAARDRQSALNADVLPRARLAIEPAVASYAAGQLPLVSVIEAIQALWLVQSDLIAADTQLGLAWVRLGRALGSYEAIGQ